MREIRHLWTNPKHEGNKCLPYLKFCIKLSAEALSAAAGGSDLVPPTAPWCYSPRCVPGEHSSVLSWLPINSEKRRFDSPSPLSATLKEAPHSHTLMSEARVLTSRSWRMLNLFLIMQQLLRIWKVINKSKCGASDISAGVLKCCQ